MRYKSTTATRFAPGNFVESDRRIGVTRAIKDESEDNPLVLVKWLDDRSQLDRNVPATDKWRLTMGYHIVLENSAGCELDGRYAAQEDDIKPAMIELITACVIDPGDVVRVIETTDKS